MKDDMKQIGDERIAKRPNREFEAINAWQPIKASVLVEKITASINAGSLK